MSIRHSPAPIQQIVPYETFASATDGNDTNGDNTHPNSSAAEPARTAADDEPVPPQIATEDDVGPNQLLPANGGAILIPADGDAPAPHNGSSRTRTHSSSAASASGHSADDSGSEEDDPPSPHVMPWRAVDEDTSLPCDDEVAYIQSKPEHSALDRAYWEEEAFFALDDPEISVRETGTIHWTIDRFNGTEENKNEDIVMFSPTVSIGGMGWRIKLYPRGNDTEFISVYLECVTMCDEQFEESDAFARPPLPALEGGKPLRKRRTLPVQFAVVLYNPAEPRVYEFHSDCHQFTKADPDYGWPRFTRYPRPRFHYREHGQRQAILRNDKLAFAAYIRTVDDPTNCLWAHGVSRYDDSIDLTGLRPFIPLEPYFTSSIAILHFAPFRDLMYRCKEETQIVSWFQMLLFKMVSREKSPYHGQILTRAPIGECVATMQKAVKFLREETDAAVINDLFGSLDSEKGAALGDNCLKTKTHPSVQAAINAHPHALETPAFLTLELQRQKFDYDQRKWLKLDNHVTIPDNLTISGTPYVLYAFTTQVGALTSEKFHVYVRPHGPPTPAHPFSGWYAYRDGSVTCLTRHQAVDAHSGIDHANPRKPKRRSASSSVASRTLHRSDHTDECAYVLFYIRADCAHATFASPLLESWDAPLLARRGCMRGAAPGTLDPPPGAPPHADTEAGSANGENADNEVNADDAPPPTPRSRQNSFGPLPPIYHPASWPTDPEGDIIMTDSPPSTSPPPSPTPASNPSTITATLSHLGRAHYTGSLLPPPASRPHAPPLPHGQGALITASGDQHNGSFRRGIPHGHGRAVAAASGDVYEGGWAHGKKHGAGVLTRGRGGDVWTGTWEAGRRVGRFRLEGVLPEAKGRGGGGEEQMGEGMACRICFERVCKVVFVECGHVVACVGCAGLVERCPVCRREVRGRVELWGVTVVGEDE